MSFEPRDYLRHILVEADYLAERSKGLTFETFVADETLRRAFVRSIEIIVDHEIVEEAVVQEFGICV